MDVLGALVLPNFTILPTGIQGQIIRGSDGLLREFQNGIWQVLVSAESWAYGDGSDGIMNTDGVATYAFATRTGSAPNWVYSLTRDVYLSQLIVPISTLLRPSGFRVHVSGTFSGAGLIMNSGNVNVGTVGGTAVAAGTLPGSQAGSAGVAGAASAVTANLTAATGGRGGNGGNGGFAPGASGTVTLPTAVQGGSQALKNAFVAFAFTLPSTITRYALGTGGTGGTSPTGGNPTGGGSSGGVIYLAARIITFTGEVQCLGGFTTNASNGTAAGASPGGGGGGGVLTLVTPRATKTDQSYSAQSNRERYSTPEGGNFVIDTSGGGVGLLSGTGGAAAVGLAGLMQIIRSGL